VKPIRIASGLVQLPAHAAAAVAGTAVGVAATSVRTTARVVGWAVERVGGPTPEQPPAQWASQAPSSVVPQPASAPTELTPTEPAPAAPAPTTKPAAKKAPAKKAPAKKAPAKKTGRKAPSKKAAVMAPALGLTEAEAEDVLRTPSGIPAAGDGTNPDTTETDLHQPGTEPLMDPATTKAVASESDMLRRAAETDKG
jgi:hypothetical protein